MPVVAARGEVAALAEGVVAVAGRDGFGVVAAEILAEVHLN